MEPSRWSAGDHELGRSYLDPNNVSTRGGELALKLPANEPNGGEIRSNDTYRYDSYAARVKVPNAPSSITGFFLYEPPDYASEIYNDTSRRIMFSTYTGGKQTHTQTMTLPFDPTTGFHDYRFDYTPSSVSFYADGILMKSWSGGVPNTPMRLYVNAWFPTWLEGQSPSADQFILVDKISYTATPAVDAVSPTKGETDVQRNTAVTATFSEEMNESTLTSSTVQLQKEVRQKMRKRWVAQWVPVSAELSYDATTRTVTLDPSVSLAANSKHRVIITTGVKDKDDNALDQNYSWTFTTIDTISSKNPDQGNTGVAPGTNITATFSEEMDPATLVTDPTTNTSPTVKLYELVRVKKRNRWVPITATQVSCDDPCRTITIDPYPSDPASLLTANRSHMVVVTTEAKEKTGNPLAQNYSWTFTTGTV
ncbi:MAG: Ig-like domain-containing protein [Actinomycetota bacterium]|nr:Ig-like domain-containing protein [Actinomycetota bacterium]